MLFPVLAVVLQAQITVLKPEGLLHRLPDTTGHVIGTTAIFGAPYYGQTLRGALTYGKSSGKQYCSSDDYSIDFDGAARSRGLLNIVVIKRGGCSFAQKVEIAQDSKGADAVIIVDSDNSEYTPNDMKDLVIVDDGMGRKIDIPSIFISKQAGNELIAWLETDGSEPILMELDWDIPADKIVTLDMWISSAAGQDLGPFVEDFADIRQSLGWNLYFNPHYHVYALQDQQAMPDNCWDDSRRYCADDPDGAGPVTGYQVLFEDVRQLCILENTLIDDSSGNTETRFSVKYWMYVREFLNSCPVFASSKPDWPEHMSRIDQFGKACGDEQMRKFLTNTEMQAVTKCIAETAEKKLERSKSEVAWSPRAVRVNGWRFSGPTNADVISRAICSAFEYSNRPKVCSTLLGEAVACLPGTWKSGRNKFEYECKPCPAGTFSPISADQCWLCPHGSVSEIGSPTCSVCPAGTIPLQKATCEACEAGHAPHPEKDICVACPGGTYAPKRGEAECLPCSLDRFGREAESVEGAGTCTYPTGVPLPVALALVSVLLCCTVICFLFGRIRSATQDAKMWQELYHLHKGSIEQPFQKLSNEPESAAVGNEPHALSA
jgi:hypothetical protein